MIGAVSMRLIRYAALDDVYRASAVTGVAAGLLVLATVRNN
ncbi:hypothetical protein [Nonomuraea jabiensis]